VWQYWSIVVVRMKDVGFPFDEARLYALPAIAGLAGATLRIPNSFLVALAGGRTTIALTTALLLLPTLGAGVALRDLGTPYATFVVLAALSGIGGGNFASSMSNISFFFPKRVQGLSLGVNAGIGNLGVSVTQFVLPLVMTFALLGPLSGDALTVAKDTGYAKAGTSIWLQNAGLFWVPILALLAAAAWLWMDDLPMHAEGSTPLRSIGKVLWLHLLGFAAAAVGLFLFLALRWSLWIALPVTVALELVLLRWLSPRATLGRMRAQLAILRKKHTWVMTVLYIMTFGSFIGYSAAFPKLIQDVFGTLPGGGTNPRAPNPLAFAWLGPLVGSLVRPVGGWLSDRWGGARVTQWTTVVMIAATLGAAWAVVQAREAANPTDWFVPFLGLFLLLFVTTGVGNGSTFRMIPTIFEPAEAGPVLGWTSAIAAYGGFVVPIVFGEQIRAKTPENALYGFAAFCALALVVNWWFYARRRAEVRC
jgi:NNP family nitrate/nitrite transporter-like MFS transporter